MTKTYEMEQKHVIKGMFQLADEVVTVKKQSLKQNIDEQPAKPLVFIDQLFIKPNAFSTEEIYDEINSIIIAVSLACQHLTMISAIIMCILRGSRQSLQPCR